LSNLDPYIAALLKSDIDASSSSSNGFLR
jgi:hypothetical protein